MNMFGLEGSGFIIAISVCLLLVGAVVYYFNTRVATLEKGLAQNAAILSNFIANYREQMMSAPPPPPVATGGGGNQYVEDEQNGATESAVLAAQEWSSSRPENKVPVSEGSADEDDNDEEDDESDDEDESSLDGEESEDEDDDDEEDSDEDAGVLTLGEGEPVSLEGILGLGSVTVMKVDPDDSAGMVAMLQSVKLDGQEVVDLTGDDGPQITEILDDSNANSKAGSEDAIKQEVSLGELESMNSLDETVESLKSSSLGSDDDLDEDAADAATAETNTSANADTDFSKLNVAALKRAAKKAGITGYSTMKKKALQSALSKHYSQ